jgi:hypothetical protein
MTGVLTQPFAALAGALLLARAPARAGTLRLLRFARYGTESKMTEGQTDKADTPRTPR